MFLVSCFVFRVSCFVFRVACFILRSFSEGGLFRVWCLVFLVSSFLFLVYCFVFGVSCFLFGVWCLVFGVWCCLFGVWCCLFGVACFVFGIVERLTRNKKYFKQQIFRFVLLNNKQHLSSKGFSNTEINTPIALTHGKVHSYIYSFTLY